MKSHGSVHRRTTGRKRLGCPSEVIQTLVLTLVIYLLIHNFVAQPFEVQQDSMTPTILNGEYILIDKLTPRFDSYTYGDVVVFHPPGSFDPAHDGIPFIKRIIGLPGDTISLENGRVFIGRLEKALIRIEEPYVGRGADGRVNPTLCPLPACSHEWVVSEGSYFVMGDNRSRSQDSRIFGPIVGDAILGRAWLRYFPLDRVGLVDNTDVTRAGEPLDD